MSVQAIYGLLAQGLIALAAWQAIRVWRTGRLASPGPLALLLPAAVLLVPVGEVPIASHLRGIWGDPSVVTASLLVAFVFRPRWLPPMPGRDLRILITLLVTLPLYLPLFLEIPMSTWDLHGLGWQPFTLLVGVAMSAILLRRRRSDAWTVIVAVALLAYGADLMESDNLWDYLVDPPLLLAMAFLGFTGICTSLQR
ncbi:MAG: hypothetical protein RLZZ558_2003 [Planctomycetota bacterium]|jgi:hypothetical protein